MVVKRNIAFDGMSGKNGDLVYYNRYGKTFTRKAPGSYNKIPTPAQAVARERFRAAQDFAKAAMADPVLKAEYERKAREDKKQRQASSIAMSDYLGQFKKASE